MPELRFSSRTLSGPRLCLFDELVLADEVALGIPDDDVRFITAESLYHTLLIKLPRN